MIKSDNLNIQSDVYFATYTDSAGDLFGLRFGHPEDAREITEIYKEIYGMNYVNPIVYNVDLANDIADPNNYWFIGISIENNEIFGSGVIERRGNSASASKAVIRKKYQGRGLASILTSKGVLNVLSLPEFKGLLRFEANTRSTVKNIQIFVERTGGQPYGFLPNYGCWGNRVDCSPSNPFLSEITEPTYLYTKYLNDFWKLRKNEVFILDNEDILHFYEFVRKQNRKMKKDVLYYLSANPKARNKSIYQIFEDWCMGSVSIKGSVTIKIISKILEKYKHWNLIEWRIPATANCIITQKLALDNGFIPVGYDPGSINANNSLCDTVLFAYFAGGILLNQFNLVAMTKKNNNFCKKVIKSLLYHKKSYYGFDFHPFPSNSV